MQLNCIDKSMQFKWVPTTYAFVKKLTKSTLAVISRLWNCLTVGLQGHVWQLGQIRRSLSSNINVYCFI